MSTPASAVIVMHTMQGAGGYYRLEGKLNALRSPCPLHGVGP